MNELEYKYIVHTVFEKPVYNTETGILVPGMDIVSFGYNNKKKAMECYKQYRTIGFIESSTAAGLLSFRIISVEVVDMDKYKVEQERYQQQLAEMQKIDEKIDKVEEVVNSEVENLTKNMVYGDVTIEQLGEVFNGVKNEVEDDTKK